MPLSYHKTIDAVWLLLSFCFIARRTGARVVHCGSLKNIVAASRATFSAPFEKRGPLSEKQKAASACLLELVFKSTRLVFYRGSDLCFAAVVDLNETNV